MANRTYLGAYSGSATIKSQIPANIYDSGEREPFNKKAMDSLKMKLLITNGQTYVSILEDEVAEHRSRTTTIIFQRRIG